MRTKEPTTTTKTATATANSNSNSNINNSNINEIFFLKYHHPYAHPPPKNE